MVLVLEDEMSKLISFDYAIKYLLKDKSGHKVIEGFINALLSVHHNKQEHLKIVSLLESESNTESQYVKKSIADLLVQDEEGNKYIVENRKIV